MSKNTPPQQDYTGAAQAQGQADYWNTMAQTYANRPDISTPFGGVRWTPPAYEQPPWMQYEGQTDGSQSAMDSMLSGQGPRGPQDGGVGGAQQPDGQMPWQGPGRWGMEVYLSPEQQAAVSAQQRIGAARSGLAEDALARVRGELGSAPDWSGLPGAPNPETARQAAIDAVYGRATSRLDPQWSQRMNEMDVQLRNQGLRPGTEAYDAAMGNLHRARTDAYEQARMGAEQYGEQAASGEFQRGLTGRQQGIAEMLQRRGWSLNEVQALLSGQQVGMPQMPGFMGAGVSQAPNFLGAAQMQGQQALDQFNAQQAAFQGLLSGGASLAALPFGF